MKEEIKNVKMGSGSPVSSEASTGVGLGSGTKLDRHPWLRCGPIPGSRGSSSSRSGIQILRRETFNRETFKEFQTVKNRSG